MLHRSGVLDKPHRIEALLEQLVELTMPLMWSRRPQVDRRLRRPGSVRRSPPKSARCPTPALGSARSTARSAALIECHLLACAGIRSATTPLTGLRRVALARL